MHDTESSYSFGPFQLTPSKRLLERDGAPVSIGDHALDILITLVEAANRTVDRRELMERVWPDIVVGDGSLRFHVAGLRRALGDGEDGARYVASHRGRGYCFVAPVTRSRAGAEPGYEPRPARGPAALPPRPSRVLGRARDAAAVTERLRHGRFVTLAGPGGVGKTTLALVAAHELRDDFDQQVAFIDLGALRNPALTPSAFAAALGLPVSTDDPTPSVLALLAERQMLLVLDNCEHLIEAVAPLAAAIHRSAPCVHLLATSREPLRVEGEQVYKLGPLEAPPEDAELPPDAILAYPACQLFVEHARAGGGVIEATREHAGLVAGLCRKLDGIALAIELVAGRVPIYGLENTAALVSEHMNLEWAGPRTAVPRHQTLQATLDWSYSLLPDAERRALDRLAVFVGHFSLDAAVAVAAGSDLDPRACLASIERLAARSLISTEGLAEGAGYRLLELTRVHALAKLQAEGAEAYAAAHQGHAAYFADLLLAGDAGRPLPTSAGSGDQLGNVRAALEWCFGPGGDPGLGARVTAGATRLFQNLSLLSECRVWCERAIAALPGEAKDGLIEMEIQAALGLSLMFTRGNSNDARVALARALHIAETLGERMSELNLLSRLHIFDERAGDFGGAMVWARRSAEVARDCGDPRSLGVAESLLGISHHLTGEYAEAQRQLELSLRHSPPPDRSLTNYFGFDHRNRSGMTLARTLWIQGFPDSAIAQAEASVREAAELDHPITHCIALIWAISIHVWNGELTAARAAIDRFVGLAQIYALGPYMAVGLGVRGELAIREGRAAWGVAALQDSLARLQTAHYRRLTSSFNLSLAEGLAVLGRNDEALRLIADTIETDSANRALSRVPELLRVRGRILAARGQHDAARQAFADSITWSQRHDALSWELRTSTDLARLLARSGDHREAIRTLSRPLARLTEGWTTRDVRQAAALLQRLEQEAAAEAPLNAAPIAS